MAELEDYWPLWVALGVIALLLIIALVVIFCTCCKTPSNPPADDLEWLERHYYTQRNLGRIPEDEREEAGSDIEAEKAEVQRKAKEEEEKEVKKKKRPPLPVVPKRYGKARSVWLVDQNAPKLHRGQKPAVRPDAWVPFKNKVRSTHNTSTM